MKSFKKLCFMLLIIIGILIAQANSTEFPKLTGPYLGQKPPGMTAEIFAPGIISFGYHEHRLAISPDGTKIYFSVFATNPFNALIMYTQKENGAWNTPALASFSDSGMNLHPLFSFDGKRLYFSSTRPLVKNGDRKNDADIWFVERQGNSWSEPVNMGNSINTGNNESSPFVTANGTLFFESNRNSDKKDMDIYVSYFKNGVYRSAEKLPYPINTENEEGGPCSSPDGSYFLFYSNRQGTLGEADIFISFKKKDGSWGKPINPGEKINSKYYDWSPSISPDGKYIFFSSYRNIESIVSEHNSYRAALQKDLGEPKLGFGTFYWVDTRVIAELRPRELK